MPSAEAQISTERADRYLGQLARHLSQMGRTPHAVPTSHRGQPPPPVQHVDRTDTAATIHFPNGTCTLEAAAHTLTVRVDADDQDALRRLRDGIGHRLETIGRREHLTVTWRPSPATAEPPIVDRAGAVADPVPADRRDPGRPRHRLAQPLALTAAAVLALVAHLGVLGGALASSPWITWGSTIILAIVAVKAVVVGLHLVLRRRARHHHRATHGSEPTGE